MNNELVPSTVKVLIRANSLALNACFSSLISTQGTLSFSVCVYVCVCVCARALDSTEILCVCVMQYCVHMGMHTEGVTVHTMGSVCVFITL